MHRLSGPVGVARGFHRQLSTSSTSGNQMVREVSGGTITTIAGNGVATFSGDGGQAKNGSLNGPQGVAVDSAGNVYIADVFNDRIRKVSGGIISTVAGNAARGFFGDGGLAQSASLNYPYGVAVDSADNLFVIDYCQPSGRPGRDRLPRLLRR